ncbi:MAG: hypothetical protein ACRBDI_10280 [Alphaproteobacteria bacterium]
MSKNTYIPTTTAPNSLGYRVGKLEIPRDKNAPTDGSVISVSQSDLNNILGTRTNNDDAKIYSDTPIFETDIHNNPLHTSAEMVGNHSLRKGASYETGIPTFYDGKPSGAPPTPKSRFADGVENHFAQSAKPTPVKSSPLIEGDGRIIAQATPQPKISTTVVIPKLPVTTTAQEINYDQTMLPSEDIAPASSLIQDNPFEDYTNQLSKQFETQTEPPLLTETAEGEAEISHKTLIKNLKTLDEIHDPS